MFPNTSLLKDIRQKLLKLEDSDDNIKKWSQKYIFFPGAETRFLRLGHLSYLPLAGQAT